MAQTKFSAATAAAVVVANMIGTGVFTSLGFQLLDIQSGFVLMMLWAVGGLAALCGALCYAELGAALPRSGGEYHFLSEIYHPAVGFVSGWISATIGFAAPTALAAITFGTYLGSVAPLLPPQASATVLVIALTAAHMGTRRGSGGVQRWFTGLKIALILGFCGAVWGAVDAGQPVAFTPVSGDGGLLLGGAFAVGPHLRQLRVHRLERPPHLPHQRSGRPATQPAPAPWRWEPAWLPACICCSTSPSCTPRPWSPWRASWKLATSSPRRPSAGAGAKVMGLVLAALLISTVSAMILAGPRVMQVIGEDFPAFRALARTNRDGLPTVAVAAQSLDGLGVQSGPLPSNPSWCSPDSVLGALYAQSRWPGFFVFALAPSGLGAAVPRPPGYPLPPLAYLAITGWTLFYILSDRPQEAGLSLALIVVGFAFYWLSNRVQKPFRQSSRERQQQGREHGGVG